MVVWTTTGGLPLPTGGLQFLQCCNAYGVVIYNGTYCEMHESLVVSLIYWHVGGVSGLLVGKAVGKMHGLLS